MKTTEQIMESIQEHASTWSLAGGRFDDGTMFEQAKQQKAALRTAIEELHRDAAMQSEIDELREKLAALTRINSDLCRVHNERLIDTARLATDATRYREIRKGHALTVKMKKTVGIYAAQTDKDYPEALDAAIDAAMEAT